MFGRIMSRVFGTLLLIVLILLAALVIYRAAMGPEATEELIERLTGGRVHIGEIVGEGFVDNDIDQLKDTMKDLGEKTIEIKDSAVSLAEKVTKALSETDISIEDKMIFDSNVEMRDSSLEESFSVTEVNCISIETGGIDVTVSGVVVPESEADDGAIKVRSAGDAKLQVYVAENTLIIKALNSGDLQNKCEIDIEVPNIYCGSFMADIGGGTLTVKGISVDAGDIHTEAGKIELSEVTCNVAVLNVGAGGIRLEEVTIGQLAAVVGAGALTGNVKILYGAEMNCSLGNLDLTLIGRPEDYNYEIAAIGNVDLNGTTFRGNADRQTIDNGAMKRIGLTSTLGNIKISFEQ